MTNTIRPNRPTKTNWATIDLDRPTRLDIIRVWYNLRHTRPRVLKGRISSSGEGVHIVAALSSPVNEEELLSIRRALGDDPRRILYDETRPEAKPSQILFDTKNGKHAGEWVYDIESLERKYRP